VDRAAELDRHRYLILATYRASGAEVATPVWFAAVDGTLYVFTVGDSGKVKRLRRSSRARVAPCDMRGTVTGPWRDATASIAADPAWLGRVSS
jgi:PPOX class probable F420-dependent enzyme